MVNYDWPGNISELENLMARSVLLTTGPIVNSLKPRGQNVRELEHLIKRSVLFADSNVIKNVLLPLLKDGVVQDDGTQSTHKTIDQNEREHIYKVLKYCDGRIAGLSGAARILGVPTTTLHSKMKRLGIKRDHSIE
jgi:transcriptional regulator with GAF, ATPase, and Fis domain